MRYKLNEKYNLFLRDNKDKQIAYESKNYKPLFEDLKEPIFGVLDIGAHIGTFMRLACLNEARVIHCYEPYPANFDVLLKNIRLYTNPAIVCYNEAVSGKGGFITLHIEDNNANHSINSKSESLMSVDSRAFDTLFDVNEFDLLKIDVEGAEYDFNFEAIPDRISRLAIEIHKCGDIVALNKRIKNLGFKPLTNFEEYIPKGRTILGLYGR